MNEMRSMGRHTVGIDVGGTKTKACLVRCTDGVVLSERIEATPCAQGGKAVLELVRMLAADMHDEAKSLVGGATGLGVCVPELVTNKGEPASNWNFVPTAMSPLRKSFLFPVPGAACECCKWERPRSGPIPSLFTSSWSIPTPTT